MKLKSQKGKAVLRAKNQNSDKMQKDMKRIYISYPSFSFWWSCYNRESYYNRGHAITASGRIGTHLRSLFHFIYPSIHLPGAIREKYGIDGSVFNDVICILCCGLCTIIQEAQQCKQAPGEAVERT